MKFSVYLDMDGTFTDLYGVENWLPKLRNEDASPYLEAKPLVNLSLLARYLNRIQKSGIEIAVISWLSKCGSANYNAEVTEAKRQWLSQHLPSVSWDEIIIVPHGTPKQNYSRSSLDILFDDELPNRENWTGRAYPETAIFEILKELI